MTGSRRLGYAALSFVAAWMLVEATARTLGADALREYASPPPAADPESPNLVGNPYLLWELSPGSRVERGVTVTVNRLGLRGPEPRAAEPVGARRIVATGDSSVYGFGVSDGDVFTAVAGRALGSGVEVIDAAVPGYSTWQTLNLLAMRWEQLRPDLLLVGNLWSDNNFDSFVDADLLATYAAWDRSATGRMRGLLAHSAVFGLLDWRLRVRDRGIRARAVGWMLGKDERTGLRRVSIDDYAANLQALVDVAAANGAETMFLLLANEEDVAAPDDRPPAWGPYRQVMRDAAARNGALLIDVPAIFAASGNAPEALFLDEMHPTALGHHLIGAELSRTLLEAEWAAGGPVMGAGTGGPVPHYDDPFVHGPAGPTRERSVDPVGAVHGELRFDSFRVGTVHIDAVDASIAPPRVLGSTTLTAPGPFTVPLGAARTAVLRVYLDEEADGPDADDVGWRFDSLPVTPDGRPTIDLDAHTITVGNRTEGAAGAMGGSR